MLILSRRAHNSTLHVCCVERNICAAHILRLSIFVRVFLNYCAELGKELVHNTETSTKCQINFNAGSHREKWISFNIATKVVVLNKVGKLPGMCNWIIVSICKTIQSRLTSFIPMT